MTGASRRRIRIIRSDRRGRRHQRTFRGIFLPQDAGPKAKILILENHDDFGGHARRNEFHTGGRTIIGYGGTQSIASPKLYSPQAKQLLAELGIESRSSTSITIASSTSNTALRAACFSTRKLWARTVSARRKAATPLGRGIPGQDAAFAAGAKGPDAAPDRESRLPARICRSGRRKSLLATSYKDYLLKYVKLDPSAIPFLETSTYGLYGVGIDAVPAGDLAGLGFPGFDGHGSLRQVRPGMGVEVTKQESEGDEGEPYIFHFPDGNASIARLLVRSLIPTSAPGSTMEDIVTAKLNYAVLDDARFQRSSPPEQHGDPREKHRRPNGRERSRSDLRS